MTNGTATRRPGPAARQPLSRCPRCDGNLHRSRNADHGATYPASRAECPDCKLVLRHERNAGGTDVGVYSDTWYMLQNGITPIQMYTQPEHPAHSHLPNFPNRFNPNGKDPPANSDIARPDDGAGGAFPAPSAQIAAKQRPHGRRRPSQGKYPHRTVSGRSRPRFARGAQRASSPGQQ